MRPVWQGWSVISSLVWLVSLQTASVMLSSACAMSPGMVRHLKDHQQFHHLLQNFELRSLLCLSSEGEYSEILFHQTPLEMFKKCICSLVVKHDTFHKKSEESSLWTREFWKFGNIVLCLKNTKHGIKPDIPITPFK